MTINHTLSYLLGRRSEVLLGFSGAVTTSTVDLKGPGGESGDGWPIPGAARIYRLDCWDGASLKTQTGNVSLTEGDRISIKALSNTNNFDVELYVNGVGTGFKATGAAINSSLKVTLHLQLIGE